ncbi:MAG: PPOX class F420-dependent oxidoreductase [Anaerolineales bacterium]
MLKQFEKQQYLNIETFRKSGQGVKTPVWFVQDGETLQIWTPIGAGKAKRIRNNGMVRVVPSTGSGDPTGTWVDARAQADESTEAVKHLETLMKKKYGAMFSILGFLGRIRSKARYTTIKIQF